MTAKKVTRARGSRDEVAPSSSPPLPRTDWRRTRKGEGGEETGSKTLLMNGVYDGPPR